MIMGSTGCRAMRTSGSTGLSETRGRSRGCSGRTGRGPRRRAAEFHGRRTIRRAPRTGSQPSIRLPIRSGGGREGVAARQAGSASSRGCRPRSDAHRASSALVPYARCVRPSADTRAIQRAAPSSGGRRPGGRPPARFRRRPLRLVRLGQRLQPRHVRRQRPRQAAAPTAAGQPRRHRPQVLLQRLRAVLAHPPEPFEPFADRRVPALRQPRRDPRPHRVQIHVRHRRLHRRIAQQRPRVEALLEEVPRAAVLPVRPAGDRLLEVLHERRQRTQRPPRPRHPLRIRGEQLPLLVPALLLLRRERRHPSAAPPPPRSTTRRPSGRSGPPGGSGCSSPRRRAAPPRSSPPAAAADPPATAGAGSSPVR